MSRGKSKKQSRNKGSSSSAPSGAKKIILKDVMPSAISVRVECHKVLWAMVEVTNSCSRKSASSIEVEMADAAEQFQFSNHEKEINEPSGANLKEVEASAQVPSKKKRKKSHFGINDNMGSRGLVMHGSRDARLGLISAYIMEETDSRNMWYDHIFMVRQEGSGARRVPVRVEGCAPGKPHAVVASVLGSPKEKLILPRDSNVLHPLSPEDRALVINLFHTSYGDLPGVDALNAPEEVHRKYWDQRYRLFKKFDMGIQLDQESWFSITPEVVGVYLARKVRNRRAKLAKAGGVPLFLGTVVDAFSGCGGCAIPLATLSLADDDVVPQGGDGDRSAGREGVLAIDSDQSKLLRLEHNAAIYQADRRIQVTCCDVREYLRSLSDISVAATRGMPVLSEDGDHCSFGASVGLMVLSPPWGGPKYLNQPTFDLRNFPDCCGCGLELFKLAASKCPNLAYIIPRNVPKSQIAQLAKECVGKEGAYLVEDVHLHGKHKLTILYIGPLFCDAPKREEQSARHEAGGDEKAKKEIPEPSTHIRFDAEDMDI